ncbi:MAG TPA: hypothetical protein GX708_16515 [Gallicola sp.]|nr:hypothetical protein [Gallicola sp.]
MKISGYEKEQNNNITLKLDYNDLDKFDKVYISKVFTDTYIPEDILTLSNIEYGGTGFFYDKAPPLPDYIEHHMPDYHLYDEWIQDKINHGCNRKEFKEYLDYSIGFLTRGCFRKCGFCVNKKYDHVFLNSPLEEFYDPTKKKICLLDDNFFGFKDWKEHLNKLQATGKPFKFKQGMDERILNEEKCKMLFSSKYDGDFTFAFDNIKDADVIKGKLQLIRKHTDVIPKFYVLCGFDRKDKYDDMFWVQDIIDTFERIKILSEYKSLPYIMRFNRYEDSPYKGMYITLARWCNQPSIFKKKSFREYCEMNQEYTQTKNGLCSSMRYLTDFENRYPDIADKYFDLKFSDY